MGIPHSGLFLVHDVVLPSKCLAAAVTHNLILPGCLRVGDWVTTGGMKGCFTMASL